MPDKRNIEKSASVAQPLFKWAPALILLITGLLYARALQNGITYMDDDEYVINNSYLRNFSWNGMVAIFTDFYNFNYHPLTTFSLLIDYTLWGLNPLPYHFVNVLLHLANVWLVYKFTMKLSGKQLTGLVVSLLFAIHPMHVESVAWISERKDVLYALFYMLALIHYLNYLDAGKNKYLAFALVFFLASLLSKPTSVTLPLVLVAIDWYKQRKFSRRLLLEKLPFLLLSIHFGILTVFAQDRAINSLTVMFSVVNRIFLFFAGLSFYLVKAVFPFGLSALHFFPVEKNGFLPWYYYLSLPFLLLVIWVVIRQWRKKYMLFGMAFFLLTISVMLQVVTVGAALAAERYTYIPYIGLFFIAAEWYACSGDEKLKPVVRGIFVLSIPVFCAMTYERIAVWKDTSTLFADIIQKNQGNWRNSYIYYYWGKSKAAEGDVRGALADYDSAIALNNNYQKAYFRRGQTREELGDIDGALGDYNEAIRQNPKSTQAYNGRGWTYFRMGDTSAALNDINKAISLDPKFSEAYNNRGWLYYSVGDTSKAMRDYDKAIALMPVFPKPYYNRAVIALSKGNIQDAIRDYTTVIRYNPNESQAYYNRGVSYLEMKDRDAAYNDLKMASELGNRMADKVLSEEFR